MFEEYTQLLTHLQKNTFLSCSHEGNVCRTGDAIMIKLMMGSTLMSFWLKINCLPSSGTLVRRNNKSA